MRYRGLSRRETVYFLLYALIVITATIEVLALYVPETIYGGYSMVESRILPNCGDLYSVMNRSLLSWDLVCLSADLGNPRIIPFLFSLALIPMTFLFVRQATKSDTAGLLSAVGLVMNPIYLIFDDSAAYHQFWAFFTISSLYLAYRKPILAAPVLLLAIIAKPAALFFIPALMLITYWDRKALVSLCILVVFVSVFTALGGTALAHGYLTMPDPESFQTIYWSLTKHTTALFIIPVVLSVIIWQRKLSAMLLVSLLTYLIASMFTTAAIFPYHMIPVVVLINASLASFIVSIAKRKRPNVPCSMNSPEILNTIQSNPEQCAKSKTCLTSEPNPYQ